MVQINPDGGSSSSFSSSNLASNLCTNYSTFSVFILEYEFAAYLHQIISDYDMIIVNSLAATEESLGSPSVLFLRQKKIMFVSVL